MRHQGISTNRLESNPDEKVFAEAWAKEAPTTLGYLLCGQDRSQHEYTQRDATVAATVIQWLGSPVGAGFLDDVQRKIAERKQSEKDNRVRMSNLERFGHKADHGKS